MNIRVKLSKTNEIKELKINSGSTVEDVLKKFNLKPDTVIVLNKNIPVPIDDKVTDELELTILQVSSGG